MAILRELGDCRYSSRTLGASSLLQRLAAGRRYSTLAVRGLMAYRLRLVGVVCRLRYPVRVLSTSSAGVSRDLVTLKLLGPWNT